MALSSHAREEVSFDFAWRLRVGDTAVYPKCPAGEFANKSGVQCAGLLAAQAGDVSAEECERVCCAASDCNIWQWCDASMPGCGCWIGTCSGVFNNNSRWTGGIRASTPAPPAPAVPIQAKMDYDDKSWGMVDTPNDFLINGTHDASDPASGRSYLPRNVSWYRKHFKLPQEWAGSTTWLLFEGVFRETQVYVNGQFVLRHDCGYTSFRVRLDNISGINYGDAENVVALRVDAMSGSGWWYEGGGIYRHVKLVNVDPVHVDLFGVFAPAVVGGHVTPRGSPIEGVVADAATVNAEVVVANHAQPTTVCANWTLLDASGSVTASAVSKGTAVPSNGTTTIKGSLMMRNVELWSIPRPYLYTLKTQLSSCGAGSAVGIATVFDEVESVLGVRSLNYTADTGLYMNGQHVKIRGFCDHNNFASVGMAVPDRINLFRAQASRSVGGNGRRTSHNPPNPEMLDIYDRVGIAVMDENRLFSNASAYVYNMGQMVQRDRQHPSVVIWSYCNEAGCEGSQEEGGPAFRNITYFYDGSRPTLANMFTYNDLLSHNIDVQGFSHRDRGTFVAAHKVMPDKPLFASECCSCTTQRGEDAPSNNTDGSFNGPCVESQTNYSNGIEYAVGTMVWTLFDYYGEPAYGGWPHVSSSFGSFDLAGFPKAAVSWYRANWLYRVPDDSADKPFPTATAHVAHIVQHWEDAPPPPPPPPSMQGLYAVLCDTTENQNVTYTGNTTGGGMIVSHEGRCADAWCAGNGSCERIPFVACNSTSPWQHFLQSAVGELKVAADVNTCLDLWEATGPNVGKFTCNHNSNQQWQVESHTITSKQNGVCMSDTSAHNPPSTIRTINAYTNAPAAKLMLNGVELGIQHPKSPQAGGPSYATWRNVPFHPGNLTLVGMDANNATLASHTRTTPANAAAIQLQIDAPSEVTGTGSAIMADGQDVALVRATIVDASGIHVNAASDSIGFRVVSGPGRVVGTHNGDPTSHENNHATSHAAYHGLVRCVVMSTTDASSPAWHRQRLGEIDVEGRLGPTEVIPPAARWISEDIVVEASARGFPSVQIRIPVSTDPADRVMPVAARSVKPVVV